MTSSGTTSFSITNGEIVKYIDRGKQHPFVVYLALNKANGKFYVGATEKGTNGRARSHKWNAKCQGQRMYIARAINKYGYNAFRFFTIKDCADWQDALESERRYIALLKPPYNLTAGGGGIKGYRHLDDTKAKMAAAKRGKPGRKMTEEMRLHLSKVKTGSKINFSETQKKNLVNVILLGNAARRRSVICLTDGLKYASLTEAAKKYDLTTGQISYHCKGSHKSRRSLQFRYANEVEQ